MPTQNELIASYKAKELDAASILEQLFSLQPTSTVVLPPIINATLNFDGSVAAPLPVGQTRTKTCLSFAPLELNQGNAPFTFNQASTKYGDWQPDEVVMFGFNLNEGGGPRILGQPGIGISFEQHYKPSGPGLGLTEHHRFWITPQGKQVRIESFTINNQLLDVDHYLTVNRSYQKNPINDGVYHGRMLGPSAEVIEYYSGSGFNYQWQYDAQGVQLSSSNSQPFYFRGPLFVEMPSAIFHKSYIQLTSQLIVDHNASFNFQLKVQNVDLLAEIQSLKARIVALEAHNAQ